MGSGFALAVKIGAAITLLLLNVVASFTDPAGGFSVSSSGFVLLAGIILVQVGLYFLATAACWPRVKIVFRLIFGLLATVCIAALVWLEATNTQAVLASRFAIAQDNTDVRDETKVGVEKARAEVARLIAAGAPQTPGELELRIGRALGQLTDSWKATTANCTKPKGWRAVEACEEVTPLLAARPIAAELAQAKSALTETERKLNGLREQHTGAAAGVEIPFWFSWLLAGLAHVLLAASPALGRLAKEERARRLRPPDLPPAVAHSAMPIRGLHNRAQRLLAKLQMEGGAWVVPNRAELAVELGCDETRVSSVIGPLESSGLIVVDRSSRYWGGAVIRLKDSSLINVSLTTH